MPLWSFNYGYDILSNWTHNTAGELAVSSKSYRIGKYLWSAMEVTAILTRQMLCKHNTNTSNLIVNDLQV